jgi:contractile injection system tube protein
MSNFQHPKKGAGVVSIGSLDVASLTVDAQYNPKELQIDKAVQWQKTNQANQANEEGIHLEFTGADGRSMSLELLFDGYETGAAISGQVEALNTMASVWKPKSTKEEERRPHLCVVKWGATVPGFTCVIESVSTKYTMFSDAGVPLRATCTVKLKEANVVTAKKGG